jgi:hypothetical protein
MPKTSKLVASLGGLLIGVISFANAATVGFQIGTDTVFKNAAGLAFSSSDATVSARFGYFADSISATTAYTDSQIIALVTSPSTGAASLGSKFVSLGDISFGKYTNTDSGVTTSSLDYASLPLEAGKFIRNWDALSTKPGGFETAGVLNPYLFVTTGSEYLVIKSDANTFMPLGEGSDLSGAWGINAVSVIDPDTDELISPRAFLVGSLGSFNATSNSFSTVAVPEPTTGVLLLSGGVGALMLRRKKV